MWRWSAVAAGLAEVFISPKTYRSKSIFINVMPGQQNSTNEDFFVDPGHARPRPIEFQDLPAKSYGPELLRILDASGIDESVWNGLDPRRNQAATVGPQPFPLAHCFSIGNTKGNLTRSLRQANSRSPSIADHVG